MAIERKEEMPATLTHIRHIRSAANQRVVADLKWKAAIRAAVAEGCSLREVGKAAGVTHVHVLRIVRDE